MEKLTIKITLNPKNYFDAQLIARLNGEENMAGALKGLAYERLAIERLVIQAQPIGPPASSKPVQVPAPEATEAEPAVDPEEVERQRRREQLEREVDHKLSKLENF